MIDPINRFSSGVGTRRMRSRITWSITSSSFGVRSPVCADTCTIDKEIQVLFYLGHMHELGSHYKLERVVGDTVTVMDDYDWETEFRDTSAKAHTTTAPAS